MAGLSSDLPDEGRGTTFVPFPLANECLHDPVRLEEQFARDGLLFFRGLLDPCELDAVSEPLRRALEAEQILDERGHWTGTVPSNLVHRRVNDQVPCAEFWASERMVGLFERFLGEPAFVYRSTVVRSYVPNDPVYLTPIHQDSFYHRMNDEFRTVWLPLSEASLDTTGGIAIALGSHRAGPREHVPQPAYRSILTLDELIPLGVVPDSVKEPWATSAVAPGDVLAFHPHALHRSLPNRSSHGVRLSMDTRIQPARLPRSFSATHTVAEIQRAKATKF